MRSVPASLCVAILFGLSGTSNGVAASMVYTTSTSQTPLVSRATTTQATKSYSTAPQASTNVPPNCIRQECGKLWCWSMK